MRLLHKVRIRKPGLVPGFFFLLLAGCDSVNHAAESPPTSRPAIAARMEIPGALENKDINEASGLAYSARKAGILWVHNDSGAKARIYAIDETGKSFGRIRLEKSDNDDWEDMASFVLDGNPYLLVGDVGDNDAKRDDTRLYVVQEPDLDEDDRPELLPYWTIEFSYEDGPRDTESVAADIANNRALLLTKRDIPPRLYEVALIPQTDDFVTARFLTAVNTLPMPSARDVEFAPKINNWHWQPTAMDISRDGTALAILTYGAVYYYSREAGEDWVTALAKLPLRFDLRGVRDAEALAFSADGQSIFVTVEKKHAPLLRIDLLGENDS